MASSRNVATVVLLLILAIIFPPVAVLCVTSPDSQFILNVGLLLLFGVVACFHAFWVVLHYGRGKGWRFPEKRQKKLEGKEPAGALESPADPQPPQVRKEADADAPASSSYGWGP